MTRKRWIIAAVAVGALAIAGSRFVGDTEPDVSPSAKTQIDRLAAEHDCVGLQAWFDATRDDAGWQLTYIDKKMAEAGCYDD